MKQLLITIAAVVLVGCGPSVPDISIHEAVQDGNIEAVKQHLAARTDVNAKDSIESKFFQATLPSKERTPLDIATLHKHQQLANLLRKHGGKTREELKAEVK